MSTQKSIGRWIMVLGQLLLFGVFVFCCIDVAGYTSRGHLMGSLSGYLVPIFAGAAMQFFGSAIGHMRFDATKKKLGK